MLKWLRCAPVGIASRTFSPWMRSVALLAEPLSKNRQLAPHHPLIEREREAAVTHALGRLREGRDAASERAFRLMFQNPVLFAGVLGMVGKGWR